MRGPSERDNRCQTKLDIMVDAFMRDGWATYSDAAAWLRDFTHQQKYRTRPCEKRRQLVHAAKNRGGEEARA
jgi:hypothetical protein